MRRDELTPSSATDLDCDLVADLASKVNERSECEGRRRSARLGGWLARDAHALASTIGTGFLVQACLVVSGVLAARILGVEDRGYLALVVLFPTVLAELGSLGIPQAAAYWLAGGRVAPRRLIRRLAFPFAAQVVVLVLLNLLLIELVLAEEPRSVLAAAYICVAATPAALALHYALGVLQGEQRFREFNLARLLAPALYALAALGIVLLPGDALILFTVAWVGTLALAAAIAAAAAWRRFRDAPTVSQDPSHRELLAFGLRGLLGSSSPLETLRPDQAVLAIFFSPTALGLYVVALSLTNLLRFLGQNIGLVAFPRTARSADAATARRSIKEFTALAAGVCLALGALLELAAPWIIRFFFGDDFEDAVGLARILVLAAVFAAVRRVLADATRGAGYPGIGSLAELAMWAALLPALALFSAVWDEEGVALAVLAASALSLAVLVVLVVLTLRRVVPEYSATVEQPSTAIRGEMV